ncbi:MAG: hypothetical protein ABJG78_01360 [Cyclobacteriaceae bacterium]
MRSSRWYIERLLIGAIFLSTITFGYGQGRMRETSEKIKLSKTEVLEPLNIKYDVRFLVKIWSDQEQGQLEKSFGLRHKPNDDQNVYLLYNYEVGNSRAEVGLSLNNFTAMTITYGHRLSFNELTK